MMRRAIRTAIFSTAIGSTHGWSDPINLGPGVNKKDAFEGQPTITPDGKTLYFVSIREDEIGDIDNMDLYYSISKKMAHGARPRTSAPLSIRRRTRNRLLSMKTATRSISVRRGTKAWAVSIFITPNTTAWAIGWFPKNLGHPINTEGADVNFFVAVDGKTAYFSSNEREDGAWRVGFVQFSAVQRSPTRPVLFLKGKLTDDQNRRVTDAKVRFENMRTKEVYEVEADSITGNYVAVMNFTSDVVMTVEREGAAFTSRYFSTEDTSLTGVTKMNVEVKEAKAGEAYRLA
jgi:hypothetical protein